MTSPAHRAPGAQKHTRTPDRDDHDAGAARPCARDKAGERPQQTLRRRARVLTGDDLDYVFRL
jgi:hypothetical protein